MSIFAALKNAACGAENKWKRMLTTHTFLGKYLFLSVLFLWLPAGLVATTAADLLQTTYEKGLFTTRCTVEVAADKPTANDVIDDLISQFQGDPERLFDWAFEGLGQQKDGSDKDAVILIWKATSYNPQTGISILNVDAVVPGFTVFHDIELKSKVEDRELQNGWRRVRVDMFYSGSLLKESYGVFYIKQLAPTKMLYTIEINLRFGWFFNIFITQRRYKALAEFRVEKFMQNLRDETERRYGLRNATTDK